MLWGVGGLTFGLTMRYLGIALGYAIALGLCAAFGTLMPPLFLGQLGEIVSRGSGQVVVLGVLVCVAGIAVSGRAGIRKEGEVSEAEKKATVAEFSLGRGMAVAVACGIMSACMAFGFAAGKPISDAALRHGAPSLWQNLPVLIVVMAGGFLTNVVWCLFLSLRNGTWREFWKTSGDRASLLSNYLLCAVAGVTWYLQFFFYSMGTTRMGRYDFSSWTLHMASIIIFSTLVGAMRSRSGRGRRRARIASSRPGSCSSWPRRSSSGTATTWRPSFRRPDLMSSLSAEGRLRSRSLFGGAVLTLLALAPGVRSAAAAERSPSLPVELRCDWMADPLGVDSAPPRLSWQLQGDGSRGLRQSAWQVLVSSSRDGLERDQGDVWDSGSRRSAEQLHLPYRGRAAALGGAGLLEGEGLGWRGPRFRLEQARDLDDGRARCERVARAVDHRSWRSCDGSGPSSAIGPRRRTTPATVKWVQVDLGSPHAIQELRFHAVRHTVAEGLGFPRRFKVEVANRADFADAASVGDYTAREYNLWSNLIQLAARGVRARYVRLTATGAPRGRRQGLPGAEPDRGASRADGTSPWARP